MIWGMNPKTTIAVALATWCLLAVVSCSSQEKKKPEPETPAPAPTAQAAAPRGSSSVSMVPGEAGGVIEETITASALVTAVDAANRRVTLRSSDGTEASFTAPPEVRNLDQVRVGDKVKATIKQQACGFRHSKRQRPGRNLRRGRSPSAQRRQARRNGRRVL
jgi:hypothetical protein